MGHLDRLESLISPLLWLLLLLFSLNHVWSPDSSLTVLGGHGGGSNADSWGGFKPLSLSLSRALFFPPLSLLSTCALSPSRHATHIPILLAIMTGQPGGITAAVTVAAYFVSPCLSLCGLGLRARVFRVHCPPYPKQLWFYLFQFFYLNKINMDLGLN